MAVLIGRAERPRPSLIVEPAGVGMIRLDCTQCGLTDCSSLHASTRACRAAPLSCTVGRVWPPTTRGTGVVDHLGRYGQSFPNVSTSRSFSNVVRRP